MKHYLLDSSFVIALLNELADCGTQGPALRWISRNLRAQVWISPVTLAEVLEGTEDIETVKDYLARYRWQGIHRAQAERAAARQRRSRHRMGENDAWQVAIAECMKGTIVGHDHAFERLGQGYEDFRKRVRA